jgi:hypothetical protein
MAQTAAQKKAAIAAANSLKKKVQAQIKKNEAGITKLEASAKATTAEQEAFKAQQTILDTETELLGKQAGIQAKATAAEVGAKVNPKTGLYELPKPETKYTAADGTVFTDLATYEKYQGLLGEKEDIASTKKRAGESAYALLYQEFAQYGLGGLVEPLKDYIGEGLSPAEFTLRLRETGAYKKRFAANAQRVAKGLTALSEAEYIGLEDQYQNIMRNYGLPASYYEKGDLGVQPGFEKFLANDVSAAELEDRVVTAQKRVINANPEVADALKQFYPDITNGDILAYTLDPTQGLEAIKRKVTAAEIGGAAMAQKLGTSVSRAEELARYGVTKEQAQQGFEAVAGITPRGGQLAAIYEQDPYTQATAETEVFSLGGSAEARKKREKISGLEKATFGGQSGMTQGALSRDRAGAF